MQRVPDLYPKVLDDPGWAEKYAESSAKRNKAIAKSFVRMLAESGFEKGRILDAGCCAGEVLIELARAFHEVGFIRLARHGTRPSIAKGGGLNETKED